MPEQDFHRERVPDNIGIMFIRITDKPKWPGPTAVADSFFRSTYLFVSNKMLGRCNHTLRLNAIDKLSSCYP